MSSEVSGSQSVLTPQKISTEIQVEIEIYWPNGEQTVGIVYVNHKIAHELSFHRINAEDAKFGEPGLWMLGNKFYKNDDSLMDAIKESACSELSSGRLRLH